METKYFLFGRIVCEIYDDEGVDSLIEELESPCSICCSFDIYGFSDGMDVIDLLNAFSGYERFSVITANDFERLNELLNKKQERQLW